MSKKEKPFKLDVVSIRLVKDAPLCSSAPIRSPQDAVAIVGKHLCQMDREVLCVINLRTDGTPINCTFASTGGLNASIAEPRELFKASILSNAASMILVHNHPSGSLVPSKSDTTTTDRMIKLCAIMQIPLLDHIIVGGNNSRYFSFREHGKMNVVMPTLETDYQQISFDNVIIDEPPVVREAENLSYDVIPVKERTVKIPAVTVDPDVIFHEDELPEEAKRYLSQTQSVKDAWENIFKDPDRILRSLQFRTSGKYPQSIIISPSVRDGIDWQVTYCDYTDEATSHSDCLETEHYKQNPRGSSLLSLYSELAAYSLNGHEVTVTVTYDEKERKIPMTKEREQFVKDIATLDWLNGKNSETSSLYRVYKEQFGDEYQIYSRAWDHAEAFKENTTFAILTAERGRGEKEIAYIETQEEMPFNVSEALEALYSKINSGLQPNNYYGHTISVNDHVAVMRHGKVNSVWSVESLGFDRLTRPEWELSDEKINALKLSMDIRKEFNLRRRIRDYAIETGNEVLLNEVIRDTRLNEIERTYDFIFKLADQRAEMRLDLIDPAVVDEREVEEMAEKENAVQSVEAKVINHDSDGIRIEGHSGTWYVIETETIEGQELFLLESEQHGDEAAGLIVDKNGNLVLDNVWNGFYDYRDEIIDPLSERIIEAMEAAGYSYDDIEGGEGYRHFNGEYGASMNFETWHEAAEWLDGEVFDDPDVSDRVEQIMHPERFEVKPVTPEKAEDVTNLKLLESEAGPHWRVHTFSCDVNGVSDTLTYQIQYHDDGEEGFTLHTVKNDIWDNLSRSELVRLERIVSSELNYQLWEKKILEAKTADELQDIRLSYMETENLNLSEDQMNRFWAVYDVREAELSTISLLDLITNVPLMDRVTEAMALAGYRIEQSADGIVRFTNERATDTLTFRSWSEAFDWIEYPGFNEEDYAIINGLDIKDRMTRVTLADVQPDPTVSITDMMNYGYMDDLYGNMLPMRGDRAKQFLSSGAEIYALYPDNTKRRITEATDPSFAAENQIFGIFGSELDRLMLREKVKLALKDMGHDLTDKDVELGVEVYSAQNGGLYSAYRASDVAVFIAQNLNRHAVEKQLEEKVLVTVQSAARSNFDGYVVLAQYDRSGTGDDQQIYLGKAENYDSKGNYDNSDNSLMFISASRKMFSFLDSGAGWIVSQQEMIDNGTFSAGDYAEYASLRTRLAGMGLVERHEKKFEINVDVPGSGVPFRYPDWDRGEKKQEPQKQRLYVDMDGTLAVFRQIDTLETLYEKGYFLNLEPHTNVVAAIKEIIQNNPEIEVYTLSAVLTDSEYAQDEKNAWLDKYLPEIDAEHRVFVPCGTDKKLGIEGGVRDNDFLLDDYTKNLIDWEPPGRGIKLLNAINHSKGTWQNDRIRYDREPSSLAKGIVTVMETDQHIYDDRVAEMSLMENMQQRRERWYNEAQADMQAGNMEKYQASMARVDEVDRAMEALKNNEAPETVLEKRKSQCERQMKKYTRDGIPELAQEWLGRWNEVRRTIELLEKEKEQTKEAVPEEQKENEQPMGEVVEEFDQIAENLAMNFTASELETELDARDDTSVPGLKDERLSGYSSSSIRKALSLMAENFPEKEMLVPEQDKTMVAIESTDDYADTGFHQNLVDDDIQNEDGSYGRVVDKYRIVTLGEDGRIVPYDAEIFDSREEALSAIDGHPRLNIVSYDDLVHEAGSRMGQERVAEQAEVKVPLPGLFDNQDMWEALMREETQKSPLSIHGIEFSDIKLSATLDSIGKMTNCRFTNCTFDEFHASKADLSGSVFADCTFENSNLHLTNFDGATIYGSQFKNVGLDGANFENSTIRHSSFNAVDLSRAYVKGATLDDIHFYDVSVRDRLNGLNEATITMGGARRDEVEAYRTRVMDALTPVEYLVYLKSGGGVKQDLVTFETEEQAREFCENHNWEWADENDFVWNLDYEEREKMPERYIDQDMVENIDHHEADPKTYKYFSLIRPISIGTYPKEGMIGYESWGERRYVEAIGREAWGEIHYDRPLSEAEIAEYDFAAGRDEKDVLVIEGVNCIKVEEWKSGNDTYVLGNVIEDTDFYMAIVNNNPSNIFEYADRPTRNKVENDYINREAERAIDRHEAEFGADGTRAFPRLNEEQYTFQQLVDIMMDNGANLADVAIGRMMDQIEEETGKWPDWNDIAPEWVVNVALRGGRSREEVQPKQENNMNEKKLIPIDEITDGNGRALAGEQILRAAVYNAVKGFQDNNDLPDYLKVLDENGQYEDKDFLYSGYDEYVALSHMDELKPYADRLAPHVEAVKAARPDFPMRDEHILLPLLAEVYYGKKNGMTEAQIDFMLSKLDDRVLSDTLRQIRHGFEDGLSYREINLYVGEGYYTQEYMREYIAGGGDLERAEALKGSDMNTAHFVLNAYREDGLSAEKGKGVVQAVNLIRNWNQQDVEDQRSRGVVSPDYRFRVFDLEWFPEYLADLAKDDRVTPEVLSAIASGFVAQRETDSIQDFVKTYGGIEEFLAEAYANERERSIGAYAGNEYYKFFYAPDKSKEADAYQKETGYHKIFASDYQGVNGDTWIVYRSVEDLPEQLQDYARMEEVKAQPSFIADFYVVEDLQKQGPMDIQRFNDLDAALEAYKGLSSDKMKALGITNTNRLPGTLDIIHCRDGVDTIVEDYKKVDGWNNSEITGAVEKITEALAEMKEDKAMDNRMVETNIGRVPIEDYREIFAHQHGFDSYDDMYNQGGRIGNGYDKEESPRGEDDVVSLKKLSESEVVVVQNALKEMADSEQRRNASYEWGTVEKSNSNRMLETLFALRGKTEFSVEDKEPLLNALTAFASAEQARNARYEWGTIEKSNSNNMLETIHSLKGKVEKFGMETTEMASPKRPEPVEHEETINPSKPEPVVAEKPPMTSEDGKEKSAKEKLVDQLQNGVKNMMNTNQFKNWLDTASHLFYNNYSLNNAILVWVQKPDASYTMGYEQWKDYGRIPSGKGTGIQIFVPVMAYEKNEGAFFRMIKSALEKQLRDDSNLPLATYKVGMSKLAFTMNRNGMIGIVIDGKECGIHNEADVKRFINSRILGKIPMYFSTGTVFDAKDTTVPEYLWVKKGFTKEEMVRDENGKAIKNKKGEYKIINTSERQAKFQTSLDMSMEEKDPEKMATLFEALKSVSERNGIPVFVKNREDDETLKGGADGYFSREVSNECPKGYIVMPSDLEPTKMCAVMLHEMGHSDLHGKLGKLEAEMGEKFIGRKMREVQAEAIAYMTGKHFGIETDTSSFSYIAAYSNGFELQDFQKSIDVIYKECQKLYKEIGAELDVRGLNMDLTEKPKTQLEKDTVETLCDKYTLFALEQEDRLAQIQKELPSLAVENKQYPELLDVVKKQKVVSDCQLVEVKLIQTEAEKLKKAETRPEQDACLENISAAQGRLAQETEKFNELSHSFLSISKVCKSGLKEEWSKNPQKAIESMKGTYPQLNNLSKTQVEYITKSRYIDKEYVPMLRNNPQAFVENACSRAEQLDKVVGKNGAFVEVNFCEQWTDQPIVRDGALMHPKVADSIVKQGEVQIMSLRTEAEQSGEYFPYSKCDVTIYALESKGRNEKNLVAYNTRVDIGDGTQKSLSDHLHQTCGKGSVIVEAFDKASRERGAKEKILFNEAPERVQQDKAKTQTNSDKNFSHAEVGKELDRIRAEKGRADEDRSPRGKGANVKSDDERML